MSRAAASPPTSPGHLGGAAPTRITAVARITPLGVVVTHSRALLAGLFLLAAFNKLVGANAPSIFAASVMAFKTPLPERAVRLVTGIVPWTEAIAAMLLFFGVWTRAAAAVLSALLVVFIALILQAIARDLDLHCGCFGKLSPFCPDRVGWCNIVQNSVMLAAGLLIVFTPPGKLARLESRPTA